MSRLTLAEVKEKNSLVVKRLTKLQSMCETLAERFKKEKEYFNINLEELDQLKLEDYYRCVKLQNTYLVPMVCWIHNHRFWKQMEFTSDELWVIHESPELRKMFEFLYGTEAELDKFFLNDMQRL